MLGRFDPDLLSRRPSPWRFRAGPADEGPDLPRDAGCGCLDGRGPESARADPARWSSGRIGTGGAGP